MRKTDCHERHVQLTTKGNGRMKESQEWSRAEVKVGRADEQDLRDRAGVPLFLASATKYQSKVSITMSETGPKPLWYEKDPFSSQAKVLFDGVHGHSCKSNRIYGNVYTHNRDSLGA